MSEAIDRVAAFLDAYREVRGAAINSVQTGSRTAPASLFPEDLREVLRLARIGAAIVQRRDVIIGALGPCGDAFHDPDAYAEHGDDCPTCATQDEALKALEPLL